jgi:hypothetical protein
MGVAGNIKQVISIIISISLFKLEVTALNAIGITITVLGGLIYTKASLDDKKKKAKVQYLPVTGSKEKLDKLAEQDDAKP